METLQVYRICFCGIRVRFVLPSPVELGRELRSFLCADDGPFDAQYTIRLLDKPLPHPAEPVCVYRDTKIYQTEEGWLRVYSPLTTGDGLQVACLLRQNGLHELYYPASKWDFYSTPLCCTHLMGVELLLLHQDSFLLHSSLVRYRGKAVLFCGASGAGKSTQAVLWEKYLDAEILNGDRCVIRSTASGFVGGGSPWAGTSGIYRDESAPIAGIFLVHQAPENRVRLLGPAAFGPLFSQTVVNAWDAVFMERITRLYQELLEQVPVYALYCRADEEAVRTAARSLFCMTAAEGLEESP